MKKSEGAEKERKKTPCLPRLHLYVQRGETLPMRFRLR